jgi:hypothetical protein
MRLAESDRVRVGFRCGQPDDQWRAASLDLAQQRTLGSDDTEQPSNFATADLLVIGGKNLSTTKLPRSDTPAISANLHCF